MEVDRQKAGKNPPEHTSNPACLTQVVAGRSESLRSGPVPRYYFHLYNDLDVPDEEGQELPDLAAAREVAIVNIRDLLTEEVEKGRVTLRHWIDIEDGDGGVLATVTFKEAVTVEG
jgi:hypothetical protein